MIILIFNLILELPWGKPATDCDEFKAWKGSQYVHTTPWSKIDNLALSLIRKILSPLPSTRHSTASIKAHRWYTKKFVKTKGKYSPDLEKIMSNFRSMSISGILN